jgi:hypothetical protein
MAARKSAAKKPTKKKSIAQQIIAGLKWQSESSDHSVILNKNIYIPISELRGFKRVNIIKVGQVDSIAGDDVVILKNGIVPESIPALIGFHLDWDYPIITVELLNKKNAVDITLDDDDGDFNVWIAPIPSGIGFTNLELSPNGMMTIGCQTHSLDDWERDGTYIVEHNTSVLDNELNALRINALKEFISLARKFIATHKPGPTITSESIRQMLLDRLTPSMKKTAKKKVARKR